MKYYNYIPPGITFMKSYTKLFGAQDYTPSWGETSWLDSDYNPSWGETSWLDSAFGPKYYDYIDDKYYIDMIEI